MKVRTVNDSVVDEDEKIDDQDSQYEITEQMGEIQLLIVAIDPAISMEIKSVTFHFQNREEGLQVFNVLAATAGNTHRTCVENSRLYAKVRTPMHHL